MANYLLLERIELNASAASVTFANIPQTGYTDLKVVMSSRADADIVAVTCSINGSALDSGKRIRTDTTSVTSSSSAQNFAVNNSLATALVFSNGEWYFPNYTSSEFKSVSMEGVLENNATAPYISLVSGLRNTTSAISSLTFTPSSGNFVQYSTFSLYGLASTGTTPAIAPKASGGNKIDTDGTYWIHTFNTSGTFTPLVPLACDYLVVAGGGGGGSNNAGGGGAGGLRSTVGSTGGGGSLESPISVTAQQYSITIGAGGTGNTLQGSENSTNGSNSVFSTISSVGGGRGTFDVGNGANGGSGGGAGGSASSSFGTGTTNQGYNGGTGVGYASQNVNGGGGGGAGEVGQNAVFSTSAGRGGNGVSTSISGTNTTYAGGGGGGCWNKVAGVGGTGGGGAGTNSSATATSGTTNTGGGGGAGGYNPTFGSGGNGGSGIVIIRYPV
jgi:hypothetical protein